MIEITFIGGPMDMKRLVLNEKHAPPYYRFAQAPEIGPLMRKPERPGVMPSVRTADYQIHPMNAGRKTVYVGLPLESEP